MNYYFNSNLHYQDGSFGNEPYTFLNNVHYQPQLTQLIETLKNADERNGALNLTISYLEDGSVIVAQTKVVASIYFWDNLRCQFVKQKTRSNKSPRFAEDEDLVAELDPEILV